jgi:hypothetical protein
MSTEEDESRAWLFVTCPICHQEVRRSNWERHYDDHQIETDQHSN